MPNLILIPTDRERDVIERVANSPGSIGRILPGNDADWQIHTIGFGVIAAAVNATRLISKHDPDLVVVAGIAGRFDASLKNDPPVGKAVWFSSVQIDGIGIGQGESFVDATELGWRWGSGSNADGSLDLWTPDHGSGRTLLTVCSASASPKDAVWRSRRFPDALAEDMESYAVASACVTAGVRCAVLRGLSNIVGCRDHSRWQTEAALTDVARGLRNLLMDSPS